MPVTFEEHEQELADEEVEEEEEEEAEAENVQENRSFDGSCRAMTGQNGAMELRFISELLLRGTPCSIDVCLSKSRVWKSPRGDRDWKKCNWQTMEIIKFYYNKDLLSAYYYFLLAII